MPYFALNMTIPKSLLDKLRNLSEDIQANTRREVAQIADPELQSEVDTIMTTLVPAGVSSPFVFGNSPEAAIRSARAYFAIIRANPTLSDGEHWIRRGDVEKSFRVYVSDKLRGGLVTIENVHPDAKWVYPGVFQVFGHRNSGWGDQFGEAKRLLRAALSKRVRAAAVKGTNDAIHGRRA